MAMPRDRTSALAAVICAFPARKPAYITPTAIPSGMLCRVTANEKLIFKILKRGEKLKLDTAKEEMDLVDGGLRYDLTVDVYKRQL